MTTHSRSNHPDGLPRLDPLPPVGTRPRGAEILRRLRSGGLSAGRLARRLDVHESAVRDVIYRRRRNDRVEQAIADALGCSPRDLWPRPAPSSKP